MTSVQNNVSPLLNSGSPSKPSHSPTSEFDLKRAYTALIEAYVQTRLRQQAEESGSKLSHSLKRKSSKREVK